MTQQKHTPGPWVLNADSGHISTPDGYLQQTTPFIETANRDKFGNPTSQALANARLIAAAPDLLAALETTLRAIEDFESGKSTIPPHGDAARAAILKAKGE